MFDQLSAGVLQSRCSWKFAKFTGKHQRRSLFNEVVERRPQVYYFIKKGLRHKWKFENFEEYLFYKRAVDNCFWMYQNINCQKVSVSELIISKGYKEAGRRETSKLLLSTYINYQRCTLVKGLFKPCCKEFFIVTYFTCNHGQNIRDKF